MSILNQIILFVTTCHFIKEMVISLHNLYTNYKIDSIFVNIAMNYYLCFSLVTWILAFIFCSVFQNVQVNHFIKNPINIRIANFDIKSYPCSFHKKKCIFRHVLILYSLFEVRLIVTEKSLLLVIYRSISLAKTLFKK